jgi:hypothetical protein
MIRSHARSNWGLQCAMRQWANISHPQGAQGSLPPAQGPLVGVKVRVCEGGEVLEILRMERPPCLPRQPEQPSVWTVCAGLPLT